ncbi:MAG: DUF4468 domain-containing protein [Bacteroidota bacterium]
MNTFKGLLLLIFLGVNILANAQLIDDFPKDKDGKVKFTEVMSVKGLTQAQLYNKAEQFLKEKFSAENEEIKDQGTSFMIKGKGFSELYIETAAVPSKVELWYTVKIETKDGRYKYEISDLYYQSFSAKLGEVERDMNHWFANSSYYRKNGKARKLNRRYKEETLSAIYELENSIIKAMNKDWQEGDDW